MHEQVPVLRSGADDDELESELLEESEGSASDELLEETSEDEESDALD